MAICYGIFESSCWYCNSGKTYRIHLESWKEKSDTLDLFLRRGFRRNGELFYRPIPELSCCNLRAIRVPVATFQPTRSQRRALRKVVHRITVETVYSDFRQEDYELFLDYQMRVHKENPGKWSVKEYRRCYVNTAFHTIHQRYYLDGKLVAIGVLDQDQEYLSSVYFFYAKVEGGVSLGTVGALMEIDYAKAHGIPYYTLGLYCETCPKLAYKAAFGPYQTFVDEEWI